MAVAVKNPPGTTGSPSLLSRLPVASFVGVVGMLLGWVVIFQLLPTFWWSLWGEVSFMAGILLGLVMIAGLCGFLYVGTKFMGSRVPVGTRAGICLGLVGFLLVLLLTRWASVWFEHWAFDDQRFAQSTGIALTLASGVGLLGLLGYVFLRPGTEAFLVRLEQQGWFSATTYKGLQGKNVRRGTTLAILVLVGAGVWTLISRETLQKGPRDWALNVPFTGMVAIDDEGDMGSELDKAVGPDRPPVPAQDWVKITAANDAGKYQDKEGEYVRREAFLAEVRQLEKEQKKPPTAEDVKPLELDRYLVRDLNEQRGAPNWVKIVSAGVPEKEGFKAGDIVSKEEFDKEVKLRKEDVAATPPVGTAPKPIQGPVSWTSLTLLPSVQFTVPLLLLGLALWGGWRVVNLPIFADFLIATEAEMNKVSWTTQKRLIQDTIVVLVTVALMAVYLFSMDQTWRTVLSWKVVGVLRVPDEASNKTKSAAEKRW
jgi:preprotein translocase SecE subunit